MYSRHAHADYGHGGREVPHPGDVTGRAATRLPGDAVTRDEQAEQVRERRLQDHQGARRLHHRHRRDSKVSDTSF